jgi:uncharacterized protein
MVAKASVFRLDSQSHAALASLSKVLGRPMNKLINEAVRDYLLTESRAERDLGRSLKMLREFRESAPRSDPRVADSETRSPPEVDDPSAVEAAREFVRRVSKQYQVVEAMLFGSRARSTHRPDSDVDVAVILENGHDGIVDVALELADIAFDLLLETNIFIQALPIPRGEWTHPERHSNPRLIENIRRDGLAL